MTETSDQNLLAPRLSWPARGMTALAVLMPAMVLTTAGMGAEQSWPAVVVPFGWARVAVVHVLATLPLSWIVALLFVGRRQNHGWMLGVVLPSLAAGAVSWLALTYGMRMEEQLRGVGFTGRLFVRLLYCLVLQLPWCVGAVSLWRRRSYAGPSFDALAAVLALVVASGFPAVYLLDLIRQETDTASAAIAKDRLWRAEEIVSRLSDVGSTRKLSLPNALGQPRLSSPQQERYRLDRRLNDLRNRVAQPLPASADDGQRLLRSQQLAMLGHLEDARSTLGLAPRRRPEAALLMVAIHEELGQWEQAIDWGQIALVLLESRVPKDAQSPEARHITSLRVGTYVRIADDLRRAERYRQAEAKLKEALAKIPQAAADFHFQLGLHYRMGGRPLEAIGQLEMALEIDPNYKPRAQTYINELNRKTPACLLRPVRPVTR